MPLTREDRIANLAKARAAKQAKFQKDLEEANKAIDVDVPVIDGTASTVETAVPTETATSTVTTVTPSFIKTGPIVLESLDSRALEICIADICWIGKEIAITEEQHQRFVAKGNPDFTYPDLVEEVIRILKEGGYIFRVKGTGL